MPALLARLVETYGLLAIVVGTFLEGETVLVLAGFAAHREYLSLPSVIGAGFLGTFLGDQLYFLLGRRHGSAMLARRPAWATRVARAQRFLARHHVPFILGFRFLYGLRTVSPFVIGMSDVPAWRFAVLNLFGGLFWSVAVATLGYSVGHSAEVLLGRAKEIETWLFLGIAVAGAIAWGARFVRIRQRARREAGEA